MTDIKSMTIEELKGLMTELGEKPFRAKQIYSWLHEHLVTSYDQMENIPKVSDRSWSSIRSQYWRRWTFRYQR